jgi:SAM-dependent methyltransferase
VKWTPKVPSLRQAAFFFRGLLFLGRRYQCPCCGWRLRGFIAKGSVLEPAPDGFCPRCNAKARHRRDWLYLRDHTELFRKPTRLIEIGPRWAFARRFQMMPNVSYTGVDVSPRGPEVTEIADVTALPMSEGSFDAALCIHVLEHVTDDRTALSELFRVLRPGGWAIMTVPLDLDGTTIEDPSITDPEERARLFGERGHVRAYGTDFIHRLRTAGFDVTMDPASALCADDRRYFGLRMDENVFHCQKPGA